MPAGAAGVLLICSGIFATIVHGKSIPHYDGSPDNFNLPRYPAQQNIIGGYNDQNWDTPFPVNNLNGHSSSQSGFRPIHRNRHFIPPPVYPPMFDHRQFPVINFPIPPDSPIPPAPYSGIPPYYNVYHGGYPNSDTNTFGMPLYDPVSFYNNPTPYRTPVQPPRTSYAPDQPIDSGGGPNRTPVQPPRTSYAPDQLIDSGGGPNRTPVQPPRTSYAPDQPIDSGGGPVNNSDSATSMESNQLPVVLDVPFMWRCPPGFKRDFFYKCRKEVPRPSKSKVRTNGDDCRVNHVRDSTGRCRKTVDLSG